MNVTKSLEFIAHNLNMTFLNNLLYETSWLYHLVVSY